MSKIETNETLVKRIRDRRRNIRSFIDELEPRGVRLTNFNIVCGGIATLLTATPAIFGKAVTDLVNTSVVTGRMLFALAALFSLMSTIAANLYKSHDMASRLAKAQSCDAKLEGLETLLELGQIPLKEAATQYTRLISEISFISDDRGFLCSGVVEGIGRGCHAWLVTEIEGLIWPKEREIPVEKDGSWKEMIVEEGSIDTFSLSLYVANNKANRKIRAWLDKGDERGDYSEFRRPRGMRRIVRVSGLRRKKIKPQKEQSVSEGLESDKSLRSERSVGAKGGS